LKKKKFMHKIISILIVIMTFSSAVFAQRVGLVLSGGGAKGAAHIGLIKAFEENEIPIDCITGTSIGAVVGSLYAMGYSPDEMLELLMSDEFGYWASGTVEENYIYYFSKADPTPSVMHFSLGISDDFKLNPKMNISSLVDPVQMNQAFMLLYAPSTSKCRESFDNLMVPFRCVGADVFHKRQVIFHKGELSDAVRASMSIPIVFKPLWLEIDKRPGDTDTIRKVPIFDGGLYENFPYRTMKKEFYPDFIIGSALSSGGVKPDNSLITQIEAIAMQDVNYVMPKKDGVLLKFDLSDVGMLDFNKTKAVMERGYVKGLSMVDSIKSRISRRVSLAEVQKRRAVYKKSLPQLIFNKVTIEGNLTHAQKKYVLAQIERRDDGLFSEEEFKRSYFKLVSNPKITEIIPQAIYNSDTHYFDLVLKVDMSNDINVDFGGNISSHHANQLYLGANYSIINRYSADFGLGLHIGDVFRGVKLSAKTYFETEIPLSLSYTYCYSQRNYSESQSLFYQDNNPAFLKQKESYADFELAFPFLYKGKASFGLKYGKMKDNYFQQSNVDYSNATFDQSEYDVFAMSLSIDRNTLDAPVYPISGHQYFMKAHYVNAKEETTLNNIDYVDNTVPSSVSLDEYRPTIDQNTNWLQMKGRFYTYKKINKWINIGYLGELFLSSKNLLTNYTASLLQASTFTPTPQSQVVYNSAFRANQYIAGGFIPVVKFTPMFHFRLGMYGFLPFQPIKGRSVVINDEWIEQQAYYGKKFHDFAFMGEAAFVMNLPFMSISLFANGYSKATSQFNVGINVGYLIFNKKMLD